MTRTTVMLLSLLLTAPTLAQQKDVFANPKNLDVLPVDISSKALGDTMKGFAMGLGVRCETCHVGEPNTPLDTFDFESDEKPMKRKARLMLRMVDAINGEYVPGLDEVEQSERTMVRCVTCHRGQRKPKLIQDVLDDQLEGVGVDGAVETYSKLREQFYGSHSYDFSEFTLPLYAQGLAGRGDVQAAVAFAEVNTGNFPGSYYSHFVLGELYRMTGDSDAAIATYRRAAELNPRARPMLDARIAELEKGGD